MDTFIKNIIYLCSVFVTRKKTERELYSLLHVLNKSFCKNALIKNSNER